MVYAVWSCSVLTTKGTLVMLGPPRIDLFVVLYSCCWYHQWIPTNYWLLYMFMYTNQSETHLHEYDNKRVPISPLIQQHPLTVNNLIDLTTNSSVSMKEIFCCNKSILMHLNIMVPNFVC